MDRNFQNLKKNHISRENRILRLYLEIGNWKLEIGTLKFIVKNYFQ